MFLAWRNISFWRRKWQPTPVLLLGKAHGWRSVVGYSPWGRKESDMTEWLHFHFAWRRDTHPGTAASGDARERQNSEGAAGFLLILASDSLRLPALLGWPITGKTEATEGGEPILDSATEVAKEERHFLASRSSPSLGLLPSNSEQFSLSPSWTSWALHLSQVLHPDQIASFKSSSPPATALALPSHFPLSLTPAPIVALNPCH